MGNKSKIIWLMLLISCLCAISSATATEFINVTYHQSHDNNSFIFVENAMQLPNGTYITNGTILSAMACKTESCMTQTNFATEIWANVSDANWSAEPVMITRLWKNEDNKFNATAKTYIYKTNNFLNNIDCGIRTGAFFTGFCIYMDEGIDEGNDSYSYIIKDSANSVANLLGLGMGIINPSELNSLLFGWTWQTSYASNVLETNLYSNAKRINTLIHIDLLQDPSLITATGVDNIVSDVDLQYTLKFRGYYQPYDIAVGIVDNTTFSNISDIYGFQLGINSSAFIAYKESNINTSAKEYVKFSASSPGIYDMLIDDEIGLTDYTQVITAGTYHLLVFQKRQVYNDQYYILLGSKEFIYQPLSSGSGNMIHTNKYEFNMQSHTLYNTSIVNYWFKLYDMNVDSLVSDGVIQSNYYDLLPYYYDIDDNLIHYINYSVTVDESGISRINLKMNNYSRMGNVFYIDYGSRTAQSSNSYFQSLIASGIVKNGNVATLSEVMNYRTNDSIGIYTFSNGRSPTDTTEIDLYTVSNTLYSGIRSITFGDGSSSKTQQLVYNSTDNLLDCDGCLSGSHIWYFPANCSAYIYNVSTLKSSITDDSICGNSNYVIKWKNPSYTQSWIDTRIYFYSNMWNLTLISSTNISAGTNLTETSFAQISDYMFRQNITIANDKTPRLIRAFINDKYKNSYVIQPNKVCTLTINWILSNGNKELKVTFADKTIRNDVSVTNSNISLDNQSANFVSINCTDVNYGTTYTSGSITSTVSSILSNLFGTWAIAPYIIALFITLAIVFYTKSVGSGAIAFMASLFVFVAMGWIKDAWVTSGIIVGVSVVMGLLIYQHFAKGQG